MPSTRYAAPAECRAPSTPVVDNHCRGPKVGSLRLCSKHPGAEPRQRRRSRSVAISFQARAGGQPCGAGRRTRRTGALHAHGRRDLELPPGEHPGLITCRLLHADPYPAVAFGAATSATPASRTRDSNGASGEGFSRHACVPSACHALRNPLGCDACLACEPDAGIPAAASGEGCSRHACGAGLACHVFEQFLAHRAVVPTAAHDRCQLVPVAASSTESLVRQIVSG